MNWRNCLKENQRYDGLSLSLLLSFFFSLSLHFCLFPRLSHRWFIRSAWRWNLSWSYSDLWPPRDLVCHAMSPRSSQSPPSPYVAKKCTLENNAQGGRLTKCPSIYRTSLTKCSIRAGIRFPFFLTYSQDLMDWLTNWLTGRLTDWNFKLRAEDSLWNLIRWMWIKLYCLLITSCQEWHSTLSVAKYPKDPELSRTLRRYKDLNETCSSWYNITS